MTQSRRSTGPLCLLISAAAWLLVLTQGAPAVEIACAVVITALSAALALLGREAPRSRVQIPAKRKPQCETAEFRRRLFDLCAALKLGVGFCERHLDSEPEQLIAHLEQISDQIDRFISGAVCPVRFSSPAPARDCRRRWPWRHNARARLDREPTRPPAARS